MSDLAEHDWQTRVVDLARLRGWLVYHPHDSRLSEPGWPDLAMVRGGRLILAELKSPHGRLTPKQATWLEALRFVRGIEVHHWQPDDWPTVTEVLK
jgi:hypothetical protein